MRCLLALLLVGMTHLCAIDIPQEEDLQIRRLPNGVTSWVRANPLPPDIVSIRVIWNKNEIPTIYALDCPSEDLNEIEGFFEFCRDKIDCSSDQVAVIAVGDCAKEEMSFLIEMHFQHLVQQEERLGKEAVTIHHIPDLAHIDLIFAYPTALSKLQNLEDLKKQWQIYFFQQLVQGRLEKSLKEIGGVGLGHRESHFLLPKRFCYGKARCTETNVLEVLGGFLLEIQHIKKAGFNEDEFAAVKSKVQKTLLSVHRRVPDSGTLATYYADQCVFGMGCPSYAYFMATSLNLIAELSLRDVHALVTGCLQDEFRHVDLTIPSSLKLEKEEIQEVLSLFQADSFIFHIEEVLEEPVVVVNISNPYAFLPITEKEAKIIWNIIDTIANSNLIALGFKKGDLEEKGHKINHVHPLRFLGTVFSDPYLKSCMKEIRTSYFKWNGFFEGSSGQGFSNRMDQEYKRNNLLPYVAGFSQAVNANPDQIRVYIQKRDWEGFVKYLLKGD